jgi:hypothetical protein
MGIPDGAHTHGHGGGGLGAALLVVLAAALAVKAAPAVLSAAAELIRVLLIVAGVILGLGAAGLVGLLAWRWRRWQPDAARTKPPSAPKLVRAAQPLPQARPAAPLPTESQRELPGELHLHLHGVSAGDVAAILRQHEDTTRHADGEQ